MTFVQAQMDAMNRGREEGIAIGEARGEARGIAIGESKGVAKILVGLVKDGVLSIKEASKRANMTEQEFAALLTVQ